MKISQSKRKIFCVECLKKNLRTESVQLRHCSTRTSRNPSWRKLLRRTISTRTRTETTATTSQQFVKSNHQCSRNHWESPISRKKTRLVRLTITWIHSSLETHFTFQTDKSEEERSRIKCTTQSDHSINKVSNNHNLQARKIRINPSSMHSNSSDSKRTHKNLSAISYQVNKRY